jgi:hypothetical protein
VKLRPVFFNFLQTSLKFLNSTMAQGTLWRVSDELWRRIRRGITTWVAGRSSELSSTATHAG